MQNDRPWSSPRSTHDRHGDGARAIRFDGQVAIVTGAGGGLGRSYALELARRGARVVVNDLGGNADGSGRKKGPADRTVAEITATGGRAVPSYESVADPAGGEAIVQTAIDAFGTVDVVINNAGIIRSREFTDLALEDVRSALDVDLLGAFHVSQPAFRVMQENGYGRLLFTSSSSGLFGDVGHANGGAAKAGLVGLANVLALEGARYGITANVLAPTAQSRLTEDLLPDSFALELVTPMAVYLVSRECETTHEVFYAGGGRFARVFMGLTDGWNTHPDARPTVEEISSHLDDIRSPAVYTIPATTADEAAMLTGPVISR